MITIDHSMWWIIWPLMGFLFYGGRYGWWGGRYRGERDRDRQRDFDAGPLLREIESQREQIDEMSARLAELENRADFTERMLATPAAGGAEGPRGRVSHP